MRRLLSLKWKLLPLVVAAIILAIPLAGNILSRQRITKAAQAAQLQFQKSPQNKKIQGTPNRILIPSLSIDLPVVPQTYSLVIKSWPVAPGSANYATETAPANNTYGQTFIYGHSTRGVFGPLLNIEPGAIVYVYTDNNHLFKYSYTGSRDVSPRQTEIVADMAKAPAGLQMITCDGPYFQYRHLMTFKLINSV